MKLFQTLLFVVCLLPTLLLAQNKAIIKGVVKDRPDSKIIYFGPFGTDWRSGIYSKAEIKEGQFKIETNFDEPYFAEMVFEDELNKGMWRPIYFIVEKGTIDMTLYPMDNWHKNEIVGGDNNQKLRYINETSTKMFSSDAIDQQISILGKESKLYTKEQMAWMKEIEKENDKAKIDSLYRVRDHLKSNNLEFTSEAQELFKQRINMWKQANDWMLDNITSDISYAGLAKLCQFIKYAANEIKYNADMQGDFERFRELFEKSYKPKFPANITTKQIQEILDAMVVKEGADFVDFTAPDIDGKMHKLSQLIKGKVAVIDLWASWCAPCLRTSKSFIPVWEKYKDKGFTIVGVAREKNDTKAMEAAMQRLGISRWINLVELGDKERIWSKYGAGNAGGKVILVDSKGVIIAMDFDASQLEKYLEELCK